jgi:hypothetical protein
MAGARAELRPEQQRATYHAGFLVGHLQAGLGKQRGTVGEELFMLCAAYGAALSTAPALADLNQGDAEALVRIHTYACIRVLGNGAALSEVDERALFYWLAEQLETPLGSDLLARYERLRRRRTQRLMEQAAGD